MIKPLSVNCLLLHYLMASPSPLLEIKLVCPQLFPVSLEKNSDAALSVHIFPSLSCYGTLLPPSSLSESPFWFSCSRKDFVCPLVSLKIWKRPCQSPLKQHIDLFLCFSVHRIKFASSAKDYSADLYLTYDLLFHLDYFLFWCPFLYLLILQLLYSFISFLLPKAWILHWSLEFEIYSVFQILLR